MMSWNQRYEFAERINHLSSKICRKQKTLVYLYGKILIGNPEHIIKMHDMVNFKLYNTNKILENLTSRNIMDQEVEITKYDSNTINNGKYIEVKDVVLYGFGRIGRVIARLLLETNEFGRYLNLKAVVVREKLPDLLKDVEKRLNLLNYDSVHGTFKGN